MGSSENWLQLNPQPCWTCSIVGETCLDCPDDGGYSDEKPQSTCDRILFGHGESLFGAGGFELLPDGVGKQREIVEFAGAA